jgi:hypothetical protein
MAGFLSKKVLPNPPQDANPDRYEILGLEDAEPNLGVPTANGYVLASATNGQRSWVDPSTFGGGTPSALQQSTFSATINETATGVGSITLPKLFTIVAMESTKAAWVRVYASEASFNTDVGRNRAQAPQRGSGIVADPVFESSGKIWWDPAETYSNQESPTSNTYPVRVTNDGSSGAVTITITYLPIVP